MNPVCVGYFLRYFDSKGRLYLAELGVMPDEELTIELVNGELILRAYRHYLKQYNDFIARSNAADTPEDSLKWLNAARSISKNVLAVLKVYEKSRVQIPIGIMQEYFHDANGITFQGIGDGFNMIPCNKPKK